MPTLKLSKAEYRLLLLALFYAAEWEDGLADSWWDGLMNQPIDKVPFNKARKQAQKYRELRTRILHKV